VSNKAKAHDTWLALGKFIDGQPLSDVEWRDLSWLSLIDRERLEFGPDNCRWATSENERADNERFYRRVGAIH